MGTIRDRLSKAFRHGIRLSWVNAALLLVTVIGSVGVIISLNRFDTTYQQLVRETSTYIESQQAAGMLNDISESMLTESRSFLQTGDPAHVLAFYSQLDVIRRQLGDTRAWEEPDAAAADRYMGDAVEAFQTLTNRDIYAMRLKAETLPVDSVAYPSEFAAVRLDPADSALSKEEKQAKAESVLDHADYSAIQEKLTDRVDASHRAASETISEQLEVTTGRMSRSLLQLRTYVIVFLLVAVLAMLSNLILIIRPINRSVSSFDRGEQIPEQGSYEMRNVARVYNQMLREKTEKQEELAYTATHDALTGVYNRADFDREYDLCKNEHIGIAIIDVDGFKHYNDVYGHDVGDYVLKRVIQTVSKQFRKDDHISRIGGDEFCVIMRYAGSADSEDIKLKVDEINEELVQERRKGMPPISISVGVAFWDRKNPGPDLLKDADKALLQMKQNGKTGCQVYGE